MRIIAKILSLIYLGLFYRIELVNIEQVPKSGAALLCANHNGMLDMFFIGYKLKRWIHWMAKDELFKNPIVGAIFRALGAFPVKRGKGDVGSIKKAYNLFDEGHIVGIFPQGHRVINDTNKTVKIKHGAALLAINSGVPIVPVAIKGSSRLFSHIKVVYGEPFKPEIENDMKYSADDLTQLSSIIMDKIFSLMEE